MQKLNPQIIEAEIADEYRGKVSQMEYFDSIASTNQYLLELADLHVAGVNVCLAEQQSKGQAQHGRTWVSPNAGNMYLSILWPFLHKKTAELSGLSIAVGVAIIKALIRFKVPGSLLHLKWPNDIYASDKKLCGILCQTSKQTENTLPCVIGVGLNITMPSTVSIDQPYTDVQNILESDSIDRNRLIGICIDELLQACQRYQNEGLSPFLPQFRQHDYLFGKTLNLQIGKNLVTGKGNGIDNDGYLLIDNNNEILRFASGEASIKKR